MKRLVIILTFIPILSQAQTMSLPVWVIDSLVYESFKSRGCDSLQRAQAFEIESLGKELIATGTALKLSESKYSTLFALLENQKESQEILTKQFQLDKSKLKLKIKRRNKLIIGETLAILGLILLL